MYFWCEAILELKNKTASGTKSLFSGGDDLAFCRNAIHVNAHEETESYAITNFPDIKILSRTFQCSSAIAVTMAIMEIAPTTPHHHDVDNPSPSVDIHYSVCIYDPSPTIQSVFQTSQEESYENRDLR